MATNSKKLDKQSKLNLLGVLSGYGVESFDSALFLHISGAAIVSLGFDQLSFMATMGYGFGMLSTLLFRPFGSIIWGHLADKYGRKFSIVSIPVGMAGCIILTTLIPDFAVGGMFSVGLFFFLRALQGLFYVGERNLSNTYISEIVPFNQAGLWSSFICTMGCLANMLALGIVSVGLWLGGDDAWRFVLLSGAIIAFALLPLRKQVTESREYINAKLKEKVPSYIEFFSLKEDRWNFIKFLCFEFLFGIGWYFVYFYCSDTMKSELGMTAQAVASHNFWVSLYQGIIVLIYGFMSLKMDALKLVRWRVFIYLLSIYPIFYFFFDGDLTESKIYIFQGLIILLGMDHIPCLPYLIKSFPVLIRVRGFAWCSSVGKLSMYCLTMFALTWLVDWTGASKEFFYPTFVFVISCISFWGIYTFKSRKKEEFEIELEDLYLDKNIERSYKKGVLNQLTKQKFF